jgi:ATP-dependent Clp protease ATP-binding subunit ClpA
MRHDKLTTQFQSALADAQSLALSTDNPYLEPVHLLSAILGQSDGSGRALLERAGVRVPALKASIDAAIKRLPQVSGTAGDLQVSAFEPVAGDPGRLLAAASALARISNHPVSRAVARPCPDRDRRDAHPHSAHAAGASLRR